MLLPRAITLGLNLGTAEPVSVVHAEEPATMTTHVVFDEHSPIAPLRLDLPTMSIEKTSSRADDAAAQKAADEAKAAQVARITAAQANEGQSSVVASQSDPDLATKRALVQQVAAEQGIDWKLLESVWQIESGKAWKTSVVSSAGAMGPMQFMPGTWRGYGAGGDITSAPDALRAAARLLIANGANSDEHRALLSYNHAEWYVQKVEAIKNSI